MDESPPRRHRSGKRSSRRHSKSSRSVSGSEVGQRKSTGRALGFFPNLSKISEANESVASSGCGSRTSSGRRRHDRTSTRHVRHRDDASSIGRSSTKNHPQAAAKKSESFLKANPSLLSVLSSITSSSDRSSRTSSTVTQQSYNRQATYPARESSNISERRGPQPSPSMTPKAQYQPPNPFDYMEASVVDDDQDGHSVGSSASSHYQASDAGSSVAPDTPSSRSTFPSPTATRTHSAPDFAKKYDLQYANSTRSHSNSPDSSSRVSHKRPSVSDVPEEEEDDAPIPLDTEAAPPRRPSSRASLGPRRRSVQLHQQEESLRQHIAQTQQTYYIDPVYGQRRSYSNSSSVHSDRSNYGWQTALQQYQWPPQHPHGAPPTPPHALNGRSSPSGPLAAPEPPDLTKRTVLGYEELALELSTTESSVKPLYRKFEYLNHRILLHLQDEVSEMEESLRSMDEFIAQLDPALVEGQRTPASRRNEAFRGSDLHYKRTQLLGNIFMKTEQYNRAMSAYAAMSKDSASANDDQVASYQEWMNKHSPVAEPETRFLLHHQDLVIPGKKVAELDRPTKHAALAYVPVALMLPLLLYSIIPNIAGRLVVTALIAVAAFIIAATTRIRQLMTAHEWAVCGAAYVLLMAAIAGCIPSHA